jgi:MarR family transcriptional regulator, organic hydroperoxide resistance regulator
VDRARKHSAASDDPRPDGRREPGPDPTADEHRTLSATEAAVSQRLASMPLDMPALTAVSNLYRAAGAIRNHFEHTVLAPYNLTWTGWVVLWVVWIWEEIETRHVAVEAGISKGTLTGVAGTLEKRGLLERRTHPDDGRRVLLRLSPAGLQLMTELFPVFNKQEAQVVEPLSPEELRVLAGALRKIVVGMEDSPA